jgi:hypothetical protein
LAETEFIAALIGSLSTDVMERATFTTNGALASPGTFDNTGFLRLFNFGGAELITQFDEFKFPNSSVNEAVIGIPEPSAMLGIVGGLGMLFGIRRSRSKH